MNVFEYELECFGEIVACHSYLPLKSKSVIENKLERIVRELKNNDRARELIRGTPVLFRIYDQSDAELWFRYYGGKWTMVRVSWFDPYVLETFEEHCGKKLRGEEKFEELPEDAPALARIFGREHCEEWQRILEEAQKKPRILVIASSNEGPKNIISVLWHEPLFDSSDEMR